MSGMGAENIAVSFSHIWVDILPSTSGYIKFRSYGLASKRHDMVGTKKKLPFGVVAFLLYFFIFFILICLALSDLVRRWALSP